MRTQGQAGTGQRPAPTSQTNRYIVTLREVSVYFRRNPGSSGRGIANLSYRYSYSINNKGIVKECGTTDNNGRVVLRIPSNVKTVRLTILGSTYQLSFIDAIESPKSTRGIQRRLNILGYEAGPVDGIIGPRTEAAALRFQADHDLATDGIPGEQTTSRLRSKVGE